MAGIANCRKANRGAKLCDIVLDGGLLSNVRATLVKELIKYFLYERQQIPVPFDHLKKEMLRFSGSADPEVVNKGKRPCISRNLEEKKKSCLLSSLTELLSRVEAAFSVYPELTEVLIILGGTVISPKESYLVRFPPPNPESETINEKACVKSLFRQLITHDLLGDMKPISPTNMSVLLYAPRNSGITWFKPKPKFRTLTKGSQFVFNITCRHQCAGSHDLSCDVSEVEISGIEPLDGSVMSEVTLGDESRVLNGDESGVLNGALQEEYVLNSCDTSETISTASSSSMSDCTVLMVDGQMEIDGQMEADTIWYQSPLVVKGYREKLPANKLL